MYALYTKPEDPRILSTTAEFRVYPDDSWAIFAEGRRMNARVASSSVQANPNFQQRVKNGNPDLDEKPLPNRRAG